MASVDGLQLRRVMDRHLWKPPDPFGPDGWWMVAHDNLSSVIVTCSDNLDPYHPTTDWVHASIARQTMPTYADLVLLHKAVWGAGYAYQCFFPPSEHVNIHAHALHLWGRLDGKPVLPLFGLDGSI